MHILLRQFSAFFIVRCRSILWSINDHGWIMNVQFRSFSIIIDNDRIFSVFWSLSNINSHYRMLSDNWNKINWIIRINFKIENFMLIYYYCWNCCCVASLVASNLRIDMKWPNLKNRANFSSWSKLTSQNWPKKKIGKKKL